MSHQYQDQLIKMKRLSEISEDFLQMSASEPLNYQKITDHLLELSGAKFGAFNLYEVNDPYLHTMAIGGSQKDIDKVSKRWGFDITKKRWAYDQVMMTKISHQITTHFSDLSEFAGEVLPAILCKALQSTFNIDQIIVVKIVVNQAMIGDFILLMEKGTPYECEAIIEIYSRQVGMVVTRRRTQEALEGSESLNKEIITSISDGILIIDKERMVTYQSNNCEKIFGWNSGDLMGKHYKTFIHEEDLELMRQQFYSIFKDNVKVTTFECRVKDKDGTFRTVDITATNGFDNPTINGILVTFHDISERKIMENALKESEEKYRLITDHVSDVIAVINLTQNKTTFVSPSIYQQRGFRLEEAKGQLFETSMTPESWDKSKKLIEKKVKLFHQDPVSNAQLIFEVQQFHKDGHLIWVEISGRFQINKNNELELFVVSRNIDERKKYELERTYFNLHDHLTGLYNRRFFDEELVRLDVERNLPISIIMGDVNGLKLINDSFGHEIGDELLIKAATVIKSQLREDEIFARIGGDEFAILLPLTTHATSKAIIHRINEAMKNEKVANLDLSVSFGYDIKEKTGDVIVDVIKKAEDNMYRNKLYESRSSRGQTIEIIMKALFEKSPREEDHAYRVSLYCEKMAMALGFSEDKVKQIKKTAWVHDIGKIGIDSEILNKKGRLNDKELFMVRKHPESGWRILNSVAVYSELSEFVMTHHEWVDGSGYPRGLKGEAIPLEARILAIADAYDVMINPTSYKKPLSEDVAKAELLKYAGIQFDPLLVSLFIDKVI